MEVRKVKEVRTLFSLLFTFENDGNLLWVYQNGNFVPGKSISHQENNQEKWLCPLRKICLLRPWCQSHHGYMPCSCSQVSSINTGREVVSWVPSVPMLLWKLSVLEISLDKELTANCLVEAHMKLQELIPAVMVKNGLTRVQLPLWLQQSLLMVFHGMICLGP